MQPVGDPARRIELATALEDAPGGFSYALRIPHEARVLDATAGPGITELRAMEITHELLDIRIDGLAAEPLDPYAVYLPFSQPRRAGAYRVDLLIVDPMPDSDGDGMPDWWEDLVGLDKQAPDAGGDADGDGIANRDEFLAGTHPNRDNRHPFLRSNGLDVYAHAATVLTLDAVDSDSEPSSLGYTLLAPPAGGTLTKGEQPLIAGSTFTQADVAAGTVVFTHADSAIHSTTITVRLRDENPDHPAHVHDLDLYVYHLPEPPPGLWSAAWRTAPPPDLGEVFATTGDAPDRRRILNAVLGRWFALRVWDCSVLDGPVNAIANAPVILVGTPADDILTGGDGSDVLIGGGGDNTLTGGGGADIFVVQSDGTTNTVTDFQVAAGDRLDLSAVVRGQSDRLADYVRVTIVGADVRLEFDSAGEGGLRTDARVILAGLGADFNLAQAMLDGAFIMPGVKAPVVVNVAAVGEDAQASETGPIPGRFTFARSGSVVDPLTVFIGIAGTAANGVDYHALPTEIIFPAGAATTVLPVVPIVDNEIEPPETVVVTVLPGDGYAVGAPGTAEVVVADLEERFSVTAIEPLALVDEGQAGLVMIRRRGMVARQTTVLLTYAGTARNGIDYETLPTRVTFVPTQTTVFLDIAPLPAANWPGGWAQAIVELRPDPAGDYCLDDETRATVTLFATADLAADRNQDGVPDALDPDFDGISTPDELLLGTDPERPTLLCEPGWNLVATPLAPEPGTTLRDQLGQDFFGQVWEWTNNGYRKMTDSEAMQPGRGYVLWTPLRTAINLPGEEPATGAFQYEAGWSLVGAVRGGNLGPDRAGFTSLYYFDGGQYRDVDDAILLPMTGYWGFRPAAGEVEMP